MHYDLAGERHGFADLRALLAAASPYRSGDALAGLAANSQTRRVAARHALADLPLVHFLSEALVPYEADDVTRLILDRHDRGAFAPAAHLTVGGLRDWLLADAADAPALAALAPGLTPEMAAAVSKLMRNQDLIRVARKCRVETGFRSTIGLPGRLATRLQPNHPTDDRRGIAVAVLDGLLLGAGDAVIGINPATDNLASCIALLEMLDGLRAQYQIPTQTCVLTHVTTAIEAMNRGAPTDLVFQSVAGSQAANAGFGVTLALLEEAHQAALALRRGTVGDNVMYFETGQGAALSAEAHHGVDQQTMEARAYGVARAFRPLLVNTVVGFIGPEYLYDGKQITRAGLEDHFCGKLLGLPMGCDACYTNHAEADQDDMDGLMFLLAAAGVSFLITVPGADDVMLGYQSLSFHDVLTLRTVLGLRPAPEFEAWLERMGMPGPAGPRARRPGTGGGGGGPWRAWRICGPTMPAEGDPPDVSVPAPVPADIWAGLREATQARVGLARVGDTTALRHVLEFQLAHARARDAVQARLDPELLAQALAPLPVLQAHSLAPDRVTFLCRPDLGRALAPVDATWPPPGACDAVFVLADGLSATAVQRHAPPLLHACVARLAGWNIAVVIATQARVALGDAIGARLGAGMAVVLIGERPGLTVADSLGAYLTFAPRPGRRDSERNCISNIHAGGLPIAAAADTLTWLMREAARRRLTGVGLKEAAGGVASLSQ